MKPTLFMRSVAILLAPCLVMAAGPFPGIGGPVGSSGHGPRATDNVFSSQALAPEPATELNPESSQEAKLVLITSEENTRRLWKILENPEAASSIVMYRKMRSWGILVIALASLTTLAGHGWSQTTQALSRLPVPAHTTGGISHMVLILLTVLMAALPAASIFIPGRDDVSKEEATALKRLENIQSALELQRIFRREPGNAERIFRVIHGLGGQLTRSTLRAKLYCYFKGMPAIYDMLVRGFARKAEWASGANGHAPQKASAPDTNLLWDKLSRASLYELISLGLTQGESMRILNSLRQTTCTTLRGFLPTIKPGLAAIVQSKLSQYGDEWEVHVPFLRQPAPHKNNGNHADRTPSLEELAEASLHGPGALITGFEVARRLAAGKLKRSERSLQDEVRHWVPYDRTGNGHFFYSEWSLPWIEEFLSSPDRRWIPGTRMIHPEYGIGEVEKTLRAHFMRRQVQMSFSDGMTWVLPMPDLRESLPLAHIAQRSRIPAYIIEKLFQANSLRPAYSRNWKTLAVREWDAKVLTILRKLLKGHRSGGPYIPKPEIVAKAGLYMAPIELPAGAQNKKPAPAAFGHRVIHATLGTGRIIMEGLFLPGDGRALVPAARVRFKSGAIDVIPRAALDNLISFSELLRRLRVKHPTLSRNTLRKVMREAAFQPIDKDSAGRGETLRWYKEKDVPNIEKRLFHPRQTWPPRTLVIHDQWGVGVVRPTPPAEENGASGLLKIHFEKLPEDKLIAVKELGRLLPRFEVAKRLAPGLGLSVVQVAARLQDYTPFDYRSSRATFYDNRRLQKIARALESPDNHWKRGARKIHAKDGLCFLEEQSWKEFKEGRVVVRFSRGGKVRTVASGDLRDVVTVQDMILKRKKFSYTRLVKLLRANDIWPAHYARESRFIRHEYDTRILDVIPQLARGWKHYKPPVAKPKVVAAAGIYMMPAAQRKLRRGA